VSRAEVVHPQVMDRPDFRRLVRPAGTMTRRASMVSTRSRTTPPSFSGSWRFSSGVASGCVTGSAASGGTRRLLLLHAHLLWRNADLEAVEPHMVDVFPPETQEARVDVKTTSP
jgi:hypothetical protein